MSIRTPHPYAAAVTQADIPASTPAPPPRPATVRTAFALLVALVVCLLLMIGTEIAHAIRYDGLIDQALRATPGSGDLAAGEHAGNLSGVLVPAVATLVLAVWLGVTAVGLRRGSNVARILTLVGLGAPLVLGLLFCVVGGLFGFLMLGLVAPSDPGVADGPLAGGDESAFYNELGRLDSGGWSIALTVVGSTSAVVAVLLAIAVAVLLLTGGSNGYFRPRPTPGPANPAWVYPQPYVYPPAYWQQPFWYPAPPPPQQPPSPPTGGTTEQ